MRRFRDFSIPQKLTWMNLLVSGAALLLASAGFFVYDLYNFRTGTVRNLGIQAQIIGSNSISALLFDDPHSAESTLSALQAAPHVMFAEIYTPDGRAFAGYRRDRSGIISVPAANSNRTNASLPVPEWSSRIIQTDYLPRQNGRHDIHPVGFASYARPREKLRTHCRDGVSNISARGHVDIISCTQVDRRTYRASRGDSSNCFIGKELFSSGSCDRRAQ